jgi:hypothetical protein
MKEIAALISVLAFAATLSLAACKSDEKGGDGAQPKAEERKPTEATSAVSVQSGLPECDAYMKTFQRFMQCEKVPQVSKDAFQKHFEATRQSWAALANPGFPTQTKKQYAEICKQGESTLQQSAKALDCAL